MAIRTFGPVRGAGVQVQERSGEKPIEPGALGFVGYAGILEKGSTTEMIQLLSAEAMAKKVGGRIPDSLMPDAMQHYYQLANGAGGILAKRVTDGNELPAELTLYARRITQTPIGEVRAKNGGNWGGRFDQYTAAFAIAGDLTAITLTTGVVLWTTDQWKGGYLELEAVANRRYPIVGNTAAGVITVVADAQMAADLAASGTPTNFRYYLTKENVDHRDNPKALSIEIRDGEENPDTEFGFFVYVDGALANQWPDLSMDTASPRYWVSVINDDTNNDEIFVVDTFTGQRTADVRPSNYFGENATVTATTLTRVLFDAVIASPTSANPTIALGATTDAMAEQTIVCTVLTGGTTFNAVSDKFGSLGAAGTLGTPFTPNNRWSPPFTITNGATVLAVGDTVTIHYKPFQAGKLVDGYIYPDKANFPSTRFRIASNTHSQIVIVAGGDLTTITATADDFMIVSPREFERGRDGVADIVDADYIAAWDTVSSVFNQTTDKGLGLVKFASPGVTATAVQQAGRSYAASKNHQYRYEIPDTVVTEAAADAQVNTTLGRSDYAVVSFPSYAYVVDPDGEGGLKLVSSTGMIHGREARIATDFEGYHKAGAGEDATLDQIQKLPTGDTILNEEVLNPRGINVIKKLKGNFVLWGDRTVAIDPTWKFKHHREAMSYYEHVLQESFGFIIFGLNSPEGRKTVQASMISFFLPEYRKGALDQDFAFEDACAIKIDKENNTAATKAAGDMFCDVTLRMTDVVERLRIRIGKAGIFTTTV